jgi:transcriptional regulator GlxA family with amidase domain
MSKLQNFGFLLFPDLEELDLVGPWEIINVWRDLFGEPEKCLTVSETGGMIRCRKGLQIVADTDFANSPPLDVLLVPGGQGRKLAMKDEKVLEFVRRQAENAEAVLSVCTGAFILEAAGLLVNKKATTHWGSLNELREKVEVVEERFVRDGKIWTAAGVSAGIDLALAFVADRAGEETAGKVQLYAEYYPSGKRYGTAHTEPQAPNYLKT